MGSVSLILVYIMRMSNPTPEYESLNRPKGYTRPSSNTNSMSLTLTLTSFF